MVFAPLAGPPFRHGGLPAHLPSAAWTPLPLTTPQDPLDRQQGPPYLGGPFTNTIQRAGRRKTVPKTKFSFHLSCSLSKCLLPCLQEGCSLVAGVKVTGGWWGLSAAHTGLSPASTFHSDQSTVSKQHPPCKKRRSGSLALSWHPPRIY